MTRWAFRWHGWLGMTAGVFFLLMGLTGSLLLFRGKIDRELHPEWHRVEPRAGRVSVDSIYRMLAGRYPDLSKIVLHDFPADSRDSYEFMLYRNKRSVTDAYLYFVFVDPYTGGILGEGGYEKMGASFFRWLYNFHYSLQLGMPGELFTALIGALMILSLLTGTIIYRKHFWKVVCFREAVDWGNPRRCLRGLHRVTGVWSLVFNGVLFFTGFWMNKEFFVPGHWRMSAAPVTVAARINIDTLIAVAKRSAPGFEPIAVNIPGNGEGDVLVRGQLAATYNPLLQGKASEVVFDASTGRLKDIRDIASQRLDKRWNWAIYRLHIGAWGGDAVRWLYVVMGLMPGLLAVSGGLLWMRRRGRRNFDPES